jgi:hypothetical protein
MEQSARCARALNRHVSRIYRSQRLARQRFSIARRIPPEKLPENGTIRGGEGVLQDARDRRRPRTHLVAYSCSDNTANLKARVGFIALAAPPGSYASRGQPTPFRIGDISHVTEQRERAGLASVWKNPRVPLIRERIRVSGKYIPADILGYTC